MNIDGREYGSLLFGALLHDVGKLLIRPEGGRRHPDAGADFLTLFRGRIEAAGLDADLVEAITRHHHTRTKLPRGRTRSLVHTVSLGDRTSSGERYKTGGDKPKEPTPNAPTSYNLLTSIFAHVDLGNTASPAPAYTPDTYWYTPRPLALDGTIFPDKFPPLADLDPDELAARTREIRDRYHHLQAEFRKAFTAFLDSLPANGGPGGTFDSALAGLYSLLHKYLWATPDDVGRTRRDTSLFDHSRITAALAGCAYLYHCGRDNLNDTKAIDNSSEKKFLLVKGDLSGIQDYLYNIANVGIGGVAKRLRTRSFFLSTLVRTASLHLLRGLVPGVELPIFCEIMASGGSFILLAPNLDRIATTLRDLEQEINSWLLAEFQGDLSLTMASLPLAPAELELEPADKVPDLSIARQLALLNERLDHARQRKLSCLLVETAAGRERWNEAAFVRQEQEFPHGLCPSCHRQPASAATGEAAEKRFCSRCRDDRRFGESLVRPPRYICFRRGPGPVDRAGTYTFPFRAASPWHVTLVREEDSIPDGCILVQCLDPDHLQPGRHPMLLQPLASHVGRFETKKELKDHCNAHCSPNRQDRCDFRRCVLGNREDCPDGIRPDFPAVKPFDCLAAAANGERLLGILKADVDWLGLLFSHGMGRQSSLSRIATMSRMLDLFFSGWLTRWLETSDRYRDIYTVYAGGDDLLLVGSWDLADAFAETLDESFHDYVARNPAITLSAGLAVTRPKYPVARSSKLANTFLDRAKDHTGKSGKKTKNSYHLFGITCQWRPGDDGDVDVPTLRHWTNLFHAAMAGNPDTALGTGIVHSLLHYAEMGRRWQESEGSGAGRDITMLRYIALTSYLIGRNLKKKEEHRELASQLQEIICSENGKKVFARFRMPLTRVLLTARREKRRNSDGSTTTG